MHSVTCRDFKNISFRDIRRTADLKPGRNIMTLKHDLGHSLYFEEIMKKTLLNVSVLLVAIILSIAAAEGLIRLFVDPIDFLKPEIVKDEVLGYRITANSAGHDAWGFRNKKVPAKADIVTIGDSQTYGDGAPFENSWPRQLQRISGQTVYNLSLGGYGPPQYLHLLKEKATKLKPSHLILGLYCGNDFLNSCEMVYGYEYWRNYIGKEVSFEPLSYLTADIVSSETIFLGSFRYWISHQSMLYRLGSLIAVQITRRAKREEFKNYPEFNQLYSDSHIRTGFKSQTRLEQINYEDSNIQKGYDITLTLLDEMKAVCEQNGIVLTALLIPTKELVYEEYIMDREGVEALEVVKKIIEYEYLWRGRIIPYLDEKGIAVVDPLNDLREVLKKERVYHEIVDDHPNARGYRVIAESIVDAGVIY